MEIKFGDEGTNSIANALNINSTLQKIGLYGNQIGDEGVIEIADALKTNSTLYRNWIK